MTPVKLKLLAVEHEVRVECPGGSASERVQVRHNEKTTASLRIGGAALRANRGSLEVQSDPTGARVFLNGVDTGRKTPVRLDRLQPGVYSVRLELDGYAAAAEVARVRNQEVARLELKLKAKEGLLAVLAAYADGTPCEGRVFVDGQDWGLTPVKRRLLATEHEVRVECSRGSASERVRVRYNEKTTASLRIGGVASGAGALPRSEARDAEPPDEPPLARRVVPREPEPRVWPWVVLGTGAAVAAGGLVLWQLGEADWQEVDDNAPAAMDRAQAQDLVDSGDTKRTAGFVLMGVGAAAAVVWAVTMLSGGGGDEAVAGQSGWRIGPQLCPAGAACAGMHWRW